MINLPAITVTAKGSSGQVSSLPLAWQFFTDSNPCGLVSEVTSYYCYCFNVEIHSLSCLGASSFHVWNCRGCGQTLWLCLEIKNRKINFLVLICENLCSRNFSLYSSWWNSVHDMYESLTRINNTHTYTTCYCMVIGSILSGSLYKMAVSAQNSWTSTYDSTNTSTCNFIITFYTQEWGS